MQSQRTILASVAIVCVTAIICCWIMRPQRYEFNDHKGLGFTMFDRVNGQLFLIAAENKRDSAPDSN